jgi:hypothetical protein
MLRACRRILLIFSILLMFLPAVSAVAATIYRSVGPGNQNPLAGNNSVLMTISGSTATFSQPLPNNIGVGDAIEYDTNNDGTVDQIAFITGRVSGTQYLVQNTGGITPAQVSTTNVWAIYRAYTSLSQAALGDENPGIAPSLRDFDGPGGKNLSSVGSVWAFACYADAVDTLPVTFSGWTTTSAAFLRIYAPMLPEEVGVSQRHTGRWTPSAYCLQTTNASLLTLNADYARIEGLQFQVLGVAQNDISELTVNNAGAGEILISQNIFQGYTSAYNNFVGANALSTGTGKLRIWNDLFDGFQRSTGMAMACIQVNANTGMVVSVLNCTMVNSFYGIAVNGGTVSAINDIAQGCSHGFYGAYQSNSDYNISNVFADAPGTNSQNHVTVIFANAGASDYHLAPSDTIARGKGSNLSTYFTVDIDNETRPALWDVGMDQYLFWGSPTASPTLTSSLTPTPTATATPTQGSQTATHSATTTATLTVTPTALVVAAVNSPTLTPATNGTPLTWSAGIATVTLTPTATAPVWSTGQGPWRLLNNVIRRDGQSIRVEVQVAQSQPVTLKIFSQQGRWVATLWDGPAQAGTVRVSWNGQDSNGRAAGSGVYLLYMKTDTFETKTKIMVIR